MVRFSMRARIRELRLRVVYGAQNTLFRLRRWTSAADVWMQDNRIAVIITMFTLLGAAAGLLLWTHWVLVVNLARQVAPVLTILSITASAILSATRWLRERRAARLARQTTDVATLRSRAVRPRALRRTPARSTAREKGEASGDA